MFDIKSFINLNRTFIHVQCFSKSNEEVCIIFYKRNFLACAQYSLQDSSWNFDESSLQVTHNDISCVAYVNNQILVLDTKGHLFHYVSRNGKCSLEKIGLISCETILSSCALNATPSLVCMTCDETEIISIQIYNLETKSVKSCGFVKPKSHRTTDFVLRCLSRGNTEIILIGCPDGTIVECAPDCSYVEIIHQCSESVVEIFQTEDSLYFVQIDGCLLEYNHHQVSMKYLPQSVPKQCTFIHPSSLVYSDTRRTFHYDLIEASVQELNVKGVISLCHLHKILFLLTVQGFVYTLQDCTSDEFLLKLNQFEAFNNQLDRVDGEIGALSIYTRAQQLKCCFMTRLCITQGELERCFKFKLELTHTCEGVTFAKSSWVCLVSVASQHVVLPLSSDLAPGTVAKLSFVLTQYTPTSHVIVKINLLGGPNSELRMPVSESVLTLLSFCSPSLPSPPLSSPLPYQQTLALKSDQGGDILHRALLSVRHTFTRENWERIAVTKKVWLKYSKELIELCADDKNKELLVKSTSEEVCDSVARIIQAGFISAGFLYSDYLHLNSIKQQAEIQEFESGEVDMAAMTKKVKELKSI